MRDTLRCKPRLTLLNTLPRFAAALQQASDQLQRYFDADNAAVQQLGTELAALAAVDVTLVTAAALTSLAQLQQYQQQLTESSL